MKNKLHILALLACLTFTAAIPALAGYYHETLNPENTPAVAPASLPATCRLLAADVTNMRPIYINCDEVAGLNGSVAVTDGGTITTIDINGGTIDATAIGGTTPAAAAVTTLAASGTATLSGDVTGDGGDQLSGFLNAQVASTSTSLTIAQCGSTIVSNSADVIVLPEASTALGCRYTFVCGTADDFDIDPADGTDAISTVSVITGTNTTTVLAPSAGDEIRCTDIGSSVTIEAVAADLWASVGAAAGIWTDVN